MKLIFAKNMGFCSGVKRAAGIADKALKGKVRPVQFLGSLVHNENVVKEFLKRGGVLKKDLSEIKPGILIIQAHGFPPLPENFNKKISIRDATCPLVKRTQILANSLWKKGYRVIIIGDKNHSETRGIMGYAGNKATVVENEKQAEGLAEFKKMGVVVQTTQNLDRVNKILKILKRKHKNIKYFNTICPEVQTRQKEAKTIAKKADGLLVIGSRSSANTTRLFQICKKSKKPVWWVNSLKELKRQKLNGISTLGVVSGTSTPNREIKKIKKWLEKRLK